MRPERGSETISLAAVALIGAIPPTAVTIFGATANMVVAIATACVGLEKAEVSFAALASGFRLRTKLGKRPASQPM